MNSTTKNQTQVTEVKSNQLGFLNINELYTMSTVLAKSTIIPKDYQNNPANCFVALEMSQRVGASPMMVMQNLYMVNGKPGWSSSFIIATINTSGRFKTPLQFKTEGKEDDYSCIAYATSRDGTLCEGPKVNIKMAKDEGWYGKNGSKWRTMPEVMLRYRAAAFFGRQYCPELLMGMQSVEEIIDIPESDVIVTSAEKFRQEIETNANTGEVVDIAQVEEKEKQPKQEEKLAPQPDPVKVEQPQQPKVNTPDRPY